MSPPGLRFAGLSAWIGRKTLLDGVDLDCPAGEVTAIIGAAGAGKSALLRLANRLVDEVPGFRHAGGVLLGGVDVYARDVDVRALRRRVAMVFQEPATFPMSVFDNVAFGLEALGSRERAASVEQVLRDTHLWDELGHNLGAQATTLSPGHQQRLCIARALATQPEVLLLDEPTAALDPVASGQVEDLVDGLRGARTVVFATRDASQAGRLADLTAFMERGRLVEAAPTEELFTRPRDAATEGYLTRRYSRR